MANIKFVGNSLLIEFRGERVLVVSDLHLGYEEGLRNKGIFVPGEIYKKSLRNIKKIFKFVGKIDKIIILGDLKHEFGKILREEWQEVIGFLTFLKKKINKNGEIIIVKGNHDIFTNFIVKKINLGVFDFYVWKNFAFLHGDRNLKKREIYDKKINFWVVGHVHPSVVLRERGGVKKEKYKCFLVGTYKKRKIIIIPSFFHVTEGRDIYNISARNLGLAWDFELKNFDVFIVEEKGFETLNFGKVKDLKNFQN